MQGIGQTININEQSIDSVKIQQGPFNKIRRVLKKSSWLIKQIKCPLSDKIKLFFSTSLLLTSEQLDIGLAKWLPLQTLLDL